MVTNKVSRKFEVWDGASPIVDYTYYAVVGITAALSWELPHNPFYYDDDLASAYIGPPGLLHRNDEDFNNQYIDKVQDSYYFGQNNNLLENIPESEVEYYNINKSETYEWNKLM